jgi:FtsZ-binding cell division protein ZapB
MVKTSNAARHSKDIVRKLSTALPDKPNEVMGIIAVTKLLLNSAKDNVVDTHVLPKPQFDRLLGLLGTEAEHPGVLERLREFLKDAMTICSGSQEWYQQDEVPVRGDNMVLDKWIYNCYLKANKLLRDNTTKLVNMGDDTLDGYVNLIKSHVIINGYGGGGKATEELAEPPHPPSPPPPVMSTEVPRSDSPPPPPPPPVADVSAQEENTTTISNLREKLKKKNGILAKVAGLKRSIEEVQSLLEAVHGSLSAGELAPVQAVVQPQKDRDATGLLVTFIHDEIRRLERKLGQLTDTVVAPRDTNTFEKLSKKLQTALDTIDVQLSVMEEVEENLPQKRQASSRRRKSRFIGHQEAREDNRTSHKRKRQRRKVEGQPKSKRPQQRVVVGLEEED